MPDAICNSKKCGIFCHIMLHFNASEIYVVKIHSIDLKFWHAICLILNLNLPLQTFLPIILNYFIFILYIIAIYFIISHCNRATYHSENGLQVMCLMVVLLSVIKESVLANICLLEKPESKYVIIKLKLNFVYYFIYITNSFWHYLF